MKTQLVGMIWAEAAEGVIGHEGGMPWHLPEDFQHLKTMTAGCPIIMGRRTWESLPSSVRPLPGRRNMVITGDASRAAEIQDLIWREIEGVNGNFARVETIKRFYLIERQLTPEDEELTPTMKLKRGFVNKRYAAEIDAMYRERAVA